MLLVMAPLTHAITNTQTQHQLQQITARIQKEEHVINDMNQQKNKCAEHLKSIADNMNQHEKNLQALKNKQAQQQEKMKHIETSLAILTQQKIQLKQRWSQHLVSRYKLGQNTPIKWLLGQNTTISNERLTTYFHTILKADQMAFDDWAKVHDEIIQNQNQQEQLLAELKQLEQPLQFEMLAFAQSKQKHLDCIQSLNKIIKIKEKTLAFDKKNQYELTQLLQKLSQQSVQQVHYPLVLMSRKMPKPINNTHEGYQKINQGIIFYAPEGEAVTAVLPGKVLFSQWLKGYGHLLILDHGRGTMSLYGHNQVLYKKVGDYVRQGEKIASVGHTGGISKNGLYFEIRRQGKAVPPLRWLA